MGDEFTRSLDRKAFNALLKQAPVELQPDLNRFLDSIVFKHELQAYAGADISSGTNSSTPTAGGSTSSRSADPGVKIDYTRFLCKNETGAGIRKGQVVYISGASTDNLPLIAKAQANALATAYPMGIMSEDVPNKSTGYVVVEGNVRDIDTFAVTAGSEVFLSAATAGAFTSTAPSPPNYRVPLGYVVRSDKNYGVIFLDQSTASNQIEDNVTTITASTYTVLATDAMILCDCSSNNITLTLPAAADNSGKEYHIKKIDSTTNTVTIDGNASETIDGSTTLVLDCEDDAPHIKSDGTNWQIV